MYRNTLEHPTIMWDGTDISCVCLPSIVYKVNYDKSEIKLLERKRYKK